MSAKFNIHNPVRSSNDLESSKLHWWRNRIAPWIMAGSLVIFSFGASSEDIDLSSLQLNDNASTLNTPKGVALRLTLAKPEQMGSAFTKNKINIGESFSTFFTFRITTPSNGAPASADGLRFVVQSVSSEDVGKPAVDKPNAAGTEAQFTLDALSVNGSTGSYNLPNQTASFLNFLKPVDFHTTIVEPGQTVGNINFGNTLIKLGEIGGTKWDDLNGDGVRTENESGIAGVTIYLDLNDNGALDEGEPRQVTDETGKYQFSNLKVGTYVVREEVVPKVKFLDVFAIFLSIHWSLISVYVILGWLSFLLYKVKTSGKRATHVELVIVSKASESVKASLFKCIHYHLTKFGCDLTVNIVIDEGSDLEEQVSQFIGNRIDCQVVIVPKAFECQAIAKGRAIEYFIRNHVAPHKWYAFVDDDNKVMTDDFLYEVPIYEKKGYTCANGILKPRIGRSKITYIADHLRWFDDLSLFRFGTGLLGSAINGMHGELLLCKGQVLKDVSFNRETITEDFAFARELIKKGYKFWQSNTVISILSPHGIIDFFRQRNRWYRGLAKDVLTADWKTRLFSGVRLVIWKLSIFGSWLLFPLWFFMDIPMSIKLFCLVGALHYYIAYLVGVINLTEKWYRKWPFLLLIPLYSVLEAIPPHYQPKQKGFIVIEK
ncbi:MAG: hypothetical protein DRR19_08820 [Candidatus Parabeggiatoa sp. nov. 1]|nr:MAG: hypothetical protein DRR19_08820 [Gammaproteobacteria bacterium]